MRDMASYDIKAVILDNHVEGSLPKVLARQKGLPSCSDQMGGSWT